MVAMIALGTLALMYMTHQPRQRERVVIRSKDYYKNRRNKRG